MRPSHNAVSMDAGNSFPASISPIGDAWCELLSRWPWDWFTTHTFRNAAHPESADKVFRVWISKLNRHLYGRRWYKRAGGVWWARASEPHQSGKLHFHALVGGPGLADENRMDWMDCHWQKRGIDRCKRCWNCLAGFARIEPPNSPEAVHNYVSKYVVKGGEIDLGGPLRSRLFQATPPRDATRRGSSPKLSSL